MNDEIDDCFENARAALIGPADEPHAERFYRQIFGIRYFEETLLELFETGVLNGTTHCCIGQEANAVGVVAALQTGDHIFSNHRCHGHFLAHTGDVGGLLAEIIGLPRGVCGGIGGSQHLCATGFKSNGILGGTVPGATGIALAKKLDGESGVSLVFMGDGALGEGVVYESLNIAGLWDLPLVAVVENNEWSQSTPIAVNLAGSIPDRFSAFGIDVIELSSTDVMEVHKAAMEAVGSARSSGRPKAVVINTYRFCSHSKNDDARPADEIEKRRKDDPLLIHRPRLSDDSVATIEKQVTDAIVAVVNNLTSSK